MEKTKETTREEANKAAYRRFYEEFLSKGNLAVVDEVVDKDVVSHSMLPNQKPGDGEG
jgi:hypothetical protein